ncbi:hypothetical protein U1Q18_016196 [Sarracenia purpurea var. burkii]
MEAQKGQRSYKEALKSKAAALDNDAAEEGREFLYWLEVLLAGVSFRSGVPSSFGSLFCDQLQLVCVVSQDSVCRVEAWAESLGPSGLLSSAAATVGVPCQYTGYGMLLVAAAMVLHLGDDSFNATVWQLLSLVDAPIGAVS